MTDPDPEAARRKRDRYRTLAALLVALLALGLRLEHLRQSERSEVLASVIELYDALYYDKTARAIAGGDLVGREAFYLAPLYSYAMGALYAIGGVELTSEAESRRIGLVYRVQAGLGTASVLLLYLIASLIAGRGVALLAALLAALNPIAIHQETCLLPTTLVLFLSLSAVACLLRAARAGQLAWWAAGGFLIGLAALAHGSALALLPAALLALLLQPPGRLRGRRAGAVLTLLLGFLPPIALSAARNRVAANDTVLLTSNIGQNLLIGNNPTATGTYRHYELDLWGSDLPYYLNEIPRQPTDPRPSEVSALLARRAAGFVREQPGLAAGLLARKLRLALASTELGINDQFYFARLHSWVLRLPLPGFAFLAPLGLLGLLRFWSRAPLLGWIVAGQLGVMTLLFVLSRYRVVMTAALIVFAALALAAALELIQSRQFRRLVSFLAPLPLLVLAVNLPVAGLPHERGFGQQYFRQARLQIGAGRFEEAGRALDQALRFDFEPWQDVEFRRAKCLLLLGQVEDRRGDPRAAAARYREALGLLATAPVRGEVPEFRQLATRLLAAAQRAGG